MKLKKAKYYNVKIYEKTIIGEYHLKKIETIYNKYEALGYGISEEEKGYKVIIEEAVKVYSSEFNNK